MRTSDAILLALAAGVAAFAFMLLDRHDPLATPVVLAQHIAAMILTVFLIALWRPSKAPLAATFAVAYAIMVANIHIELAFFMDVAPDQRAAMLGIATMHCALAVGLARLASPRGGDAPTVAEWTARGVANWILRIAAAAFVYVALYVVIGAAFYTYTMPYYEKVAGLALQVPDIATVLSVQIARGAVYALAALVFALTTPRAQRPTLIAMALFAGLGGIAPLLANTDWPLELRIAHAVEILLQNATFAAIALMLLKTRPIESRAQT